MLLESIAYLPLLVEVVHDRVGGEEDEHAAGRLTGDGDERAAHLAYHVAVVARRVGELEGLVTRLAAALQHRHEHLVLVDHVTVADHHRRVSAATSQKGNRSSR